MKDNTSASPKALICSKCFELQCDSSHDTTSEFYCEHNQVWAIRRPDGGWLLSTMISPEDHRALIEDAKKLQAVDESVVPETLAEARVH